MSYPTRTLVSLCSRAPQYGANAKAIERLPGDNRPRYVRITDIDADGALATPGGMVADTDDWMEYSLNSNSIVFARSGNTVGKAYLYREADGPCIFAGYLIRFEIDPKQAAPGYVWFFTRSRNYQSWIQSKKRTAGQPNINGAEFSKLLIPVCRPIEQERIVELLWQADALCAKRKEGLRLATQIRKEAFRETFPLEERVATDLNLDDIFDDVSRLGARVQTKEYKSSGTYPIIDQGESEIAGFTDDPSLLFQGSLPVVLFGDHTRIFKYVDKPFCMGADGLRVLSPRPGYAPEFAFQQCAALNIPSAGYSRHFKYLREQRFFKGSSSAQERFAKIFQTTRSALERIEQSASMLETLFQTLLQRAFDGRLTAKWREAHAKELLEEMQLQSRGS